MILIHKKPFLAYSVYGVPIEESAFVYWGVEPRFSNVFREIVKQFCIQLSHIKRIFSYTGIMNISIFDLIRFRSGFPIVRLSG